MMPKSTLLQNRLKNIKASILNGDLEVVVESIMIDLQPFSSTYKYEDANYSIPITHRIFCNIEDTDNHLDEYCYFSIENKIYKVIYGLTYSDYYELMCYECEVIR